MADDKISVPKTRDKHVFKFLIEAGGLLEIDEFSIAAAGYSQKKRFNVSEKDELADAIFGGSDRYAIQYASLEFPHFSLAFSRRTGEGADIAFDVVSISNSTNQNPNGRRLTDEQAEGLNDLIHNTFMAQVDQSAAIYKDGKAFRQVIASHQSMTERLQDAVVTVGEQIAAARRDLEAEFAARKINLEAEFDARQTAADQTLEEARRAAIKREEEITLHLKELDDRNNTHARRELHRDLKAKIAERAGKFQVTNETRRNRLPIHLGVISSSAVMLYLIYLYTGQFADNLEKASPILLTVLAIKPLGITIALLGLMAWYLRWMNRWFERYADTEFHLKQFELDIDRASWAVEAALEWKLSQDRPMPENLLETISRNLFSKNEKDEASDMHPADYLASAILGRASALNLKVPGGEISLTGRDLRKLQKDEGTQ